MAGDVNGVGRTWRARPLPDRSNLPGAPRQRVSFAGFPLDEREQAWPGAQGCRAAPRSTCGVRSFGLSAVTLTRLVASGPVSFEVIIVGPILVVFAHQFE